MSYSVISTFSAGVDVSRPRHSAPAGSLYAAKNCHLTRGGDLEKRKSFVATYSLPSGTVGLAKNYAGLVVFGSGATPAGMPAGIFYRQLVHPTNAALKLVKLISWDQWAGMIYAIVQYENGDIRHFYDGTLVSDWNAGGNKPVGWGSIAHTFGRKIYSPVNSVLWFSAVDSATTFDITQPGSGFQNMSTHQSGSDVVTGLGEFQQYLAIFSRRVIQVWSMQPDDEQNAPVQTLRETGTRAPRSVIGYGAIDCFYLSDSGIRSLKARSGTNSAAVNDIGTPIDTLIRDFIQTIDDVDVTNAVAIIEPLDGRLWLSIANRIFVFSYFPSKKIAAWTWYETGHRFTDMVSMNDRVYCREADTIYLYGGAANNVYDSDTKVSIELPFLSMEKPGTFKAIKGMDIAAKGNWNCRILINPNDENEYVDIGDLAEVTFPQEIIASVGSTTHFAPVLTHQGAGYASLSQVAIFIDAEDEKT